MRTWTEAAPTTRNQEEEKNRREEDRGERKGLDTIEIGPL